MPATPFDLRLGRFRNRLIKPGPPGSIEVNPRGLLARNLWSLLLFENPAAAPGFRDYANLTRSFIYYGTSQVATTTPYGGHALSFPIDNAESCQFDNTAPVQPTTMSASFLAKFDGSSVTGRGQIVSPFWDLGSGNEFKVDTAGTNMWTDINSNTFLAPAVTSLNGWNRITATFDGTTGRTSLNGLPVDSGGTLPSWALAPSRVCMDWPWPMADFFFWFNRVLTPQEILAHYLDPYGTTLRPKHYPLGVVGTVAAVGKKPGLLTLGVGA